MTDTTVVIATFQSPVEANIARTRLEEHGISCRLDDENMMVADPLLGAAVGGIKLVIREDDADEAVEVLRDAPAGDPGSIIDDDWDDFESDEAESSQLASSTLACPKCHSQEIGFGSLFHWYWSAVILLGIGPIFLPETAATAFLKDTHGIIFYAGAFIGFWLAVLRQFPLRCKECDAQGPRRLFQGNLD
jgi:hypothetical protein